MTRRHLTLLCIAALALSWPWLPEFTVTLFSYIALYSLVAAGLVMLTGVGWMASFRPAGLLGRGRPPILETEFRARFEQVEVRDGDGSAAWHGHSRGGDWPQCWRS